MPYGWAPIFLITSKPSDIIKQSIPFTYLSLQATSNDGQPHSVQVYSDISAGERHSCNYVPGHSNLGFMLEWVSGDRGITVNWDSIANDTIIAHQIFATTPKAFSEVNQQAEDARSIIAALPVSRIHGIATM